MEKLLFQIQNVQDAENLGKRMLRMGTRFVVVVKYVDIVIVRLK